MLPMLATSRSAPGEGRRSAPTLSAAVGVSALAHTAAIVALLTFKPVPPLAPALEVIEVSVVLEAPASPRMNNLFGSVDVLVALMRPDIIPTSPDWPVGRPFDVAPAFGWPPHAPAFDRLATELDCLAVSSERSRRPHPPCISDDPPLRARAAALLPAYSSRASETGADNDYRTFKPSQSVFNENPLPDEIPQANRVFENWIVGLFK
jgi:hypothetical protein